MLQDKELIKLVKRLENVNIELTHIYATSFRDDPTLANKALDVENLNQELMTIIYQEYGISPTDDLKQKS